MLSSSLTVKERFDKDEEEEDVDKLECLSAIEDEDDMYSVMHKVSSCFFSVASDLDHQDQIDLDHHEYFIEDENEHNEEKMNGDYLDWRHEHFSDDILEIEVPVKSPKNISLKAKEVKEDSRVRGGSKNDELTSASTSVLPDKKISKENRVRKSWNAVDVLCHDIMMHVLSFLPTSSIAAFSETARRPNFECFYFLQLQLERASLWDQIENVTGTVNFSTNETQLRSQFNHSENYFDSSNSFFCPKQNPSQLGSIEKQKMDAQQILSPFQSSSILARLALLSPTSAQRLLEQYLQSNSSLRNNMSGSHRLAYLRHAFKAHFHLPLSMPHFPSMNSKNHTNVAAAAVFMTVLGGAYASFVGVGAGVADNANIPAAGQALLSVGLGALMNMKKPTFLTKKDATNDNTETDSDHLTESKEPEKQDDNQNEDNLDVVDEEYDKQLYAMEHPCTPNPYDHIISNLETTKAKLNDDCYGNDSSSSSSSSTTNSISDNINDNNASSNHNINNISDTPGTTEILTMIKKPSGCIGAYQSTLHQAKVQIQAIITQTRKSRYSALSEAEQEMYGTQFIDACSADENLDSVKHFVQKLGIPVNAFYLGNDGTLTSPLHVAAFNGACHVLEYLCQGIYPHPDAMAEEFDGGLADLDLQDDNGWTAMHFAAGANSVKAVQILHHFDANLQLEATNGYTPYRWAERLSNYDVQRELERLGADKRFLNIPMFGGSSSNSNGHSNNSHANGRSLEGLAESLAVRFLGS